MVRDSIHLVYRRIGGPALRQAITTTLKSSLSRLQSSEPTESQAVPELPLKGYTPSQVPSPLLDMLSDSQLEQLNALLPFRCFTVDAQGRRFGSPEGGKKRLNPQQLPDRRVGMFDAEVDLSKKRVLEVGCFEGVHTTALCAKAASVTALDSRVDNVVKTIVRSALYDQHPRVGVCDLEELQGTTPEWLHADALFHVGVLYHLTDPVGHLNVLLSGITDAVLLDTHVAREEQLNQEYFALGKNWRYYQYGESGKYGAAFAGMRDHAKWITEEDLHRALVLCGFSTIKTLEVRNEKNGKRVCLIARRCIH